jgi:hypothetical protein
MSAFILIPTVAFLMEDILKRYERHDHLCCNLFVSFISVQAPSKDNALIEAGWKFAGLFFTSSDTFRPRRGDIIYTITFKSNNELTDIVTVQYKGKYKIKRITFSKSEYSFQKLLCQVRMILTNLNAA